ncbi:MAG: hypothetical protein LLG02_08930 [Pelosinus sp.]|nr:hypothetical protein [Pelosinus sp.]
MRKVQRLSLAVMFCLVTMLACVNVAMAAEDNSRATVIAAYRKLAEVTSYHMTMTGNMSMSIEGKDFQAAMNSEMDILIRPLLCKNNMDMTFNANGKEKHESIVQYVERSGKQILTYSYINGKWARQSLPGGEYNPARDFGDFVKAIKSAVLVSEDDNSAVYEVTADGRYLKDSMKRQMDSIGLKKMGMADGLVGALGDLTYTITIDKNAGTISGMDLDLSPFLVAIGDNMANQLPGPEEKKQELREMFSSMQMQMSFTLSQFDSIEPFTIPDEARAD